MPKKGYVEIDIEACKGCSLCVLNCPTECLALNTSDTNSYSLHYSYVVDQDKCIACMNCAVICPDAAITVYREVKRPEKEMAEVSGKVDEGVDEELDEEEKAQAKGEMEKVEIKGTGGGEIG